MKNIIYIVLLLLGLYSCQDNVADGGLTSPTVDKTTVEFLRTQPKFDTIMILFEKAGLLNQLDKQNATVIMPTNYSVLQFIKQLEAQKIKEHDDENLKYTFNDLIGDIDLYKDSLKMYIVNQPITRDVLLAATDGKIETHSLLGNDVEISIVSTKLYTEWLPNSDVKLIHYKNVINGLDPSDNTSVATENKDVDNICQTSGIITKTGVLHVLEDTHNLFFNKRPRITN